MYVILDRALPHLGDGLKPKPLEFRRFAARKLSNKTAGTN
jgi:hypothetical protein